MQQKVGRNDNFARGESKWKLKAGLPDSDMDIRKHADGARSNGAQSTRLDRTTKYSGVGLFLGQVSHDGQPEHLVLIRLDYQQQPQGEFGESE